MSEKRRCNRCGNLLPADAGDNTCPDYMLRAGLEPASEALTSGGPGATDVTFSFEPAQPGHVLESLARTIGSVPRVLLPDTSPDDAGVAIIKPSSDEMPAPAERGDRYLLFGEIARGGMGAVLKRRDPDLAVKVLLESHEHKPEMMRRFVEEAQIGGQLQHPGIVPVYELGEFADQRPNFTMKLVKGRTFSTVLAERHSPAHELPRLLSIFEAICQTLAYSHARGVIHRDLKPANVMVGSFGEVQVMPLTAITPSTSARPRSIWRACRPPWPWPTTTWAPRWLGRRSSTLQTPNFAKRSDSSPTTPRPITISASLSIYRGNTRRPPPRTARRSGSSPTTPKPTVTSA